ncbi:MAG: hypothetical protein O3A20_07310 [Planctomycetota bacterium]|nr:hypothetical protein [Planctomycetota bacterium]
MLSVFGLLLSTLAPQAEPLVVEERVLLEVPEAASASVQGCAVSPTGDRAICVLGFSDDLAALYGHGIGENEVGTSDRHRYVSTPQFSEDGAHLAWSWGDPKGKKTEEWEIWLDGKRLKTWDWIGSWSFSSRGELAYQAADGLEISKEAWYQGGDYYVVRGKKKSSKYSNFGPTTPLWSPDGKKLAFHASKPSGSHVVVDGKEFGPYSWVQSICWMDDGKNLVWSAMNSEGKTHIIAGKQEYGGERESVGAPASGGGSLAYLYASNNRRGLIFRDAVVPGLYDDLGTPAVSPDGAHVAVAAARGREAVEAGWIMVDPSWMDGAMTRNEVNEEASESGETQGAEASASKQGCYLLVDGKRVGEEWLRVVRPFFSPDSQHVAVRVLSRDGWHVQRDGRATAAYDEVVAPRFTADGALEFGARRGRTILFARVPRAAE